MHGACHVAAEYWRCGKPLCLYADDREQADKLDTLLWTFADTAFIPHSLCEQEENRIGVAIGWDTHLPAGMDCVVNLAGNMPDILSGFSRIIEIIPPDRAEKEMARQRYRQGREKGWRLEYRELSRWEETCESHRS